MLYQTERQVRDYMKIIGIVAEYNPFHNGHAYQLACAKNHFDADAVIVVMSGNFTQRGTPAVFDMQTRAKMALSCGADLVLELPVIFSTASAELFAGGAVSVLNSTGIVDELLFGCETENMTLFEKAAALMDESESSRIQFRKSISSGNTYASARVSALASGPLKTFLSTPNNLLGTEYVRALRHLSSTIRPVCLQRKGSLYHDRTPAGSFISASALRESIKTDQTDLMGHLKNCTPEILHSLYRKKINNGEIVHENDISLLLHERLYETDDFSLYMDCSEALSHKILRFRDEFVSFEQFCGLLKSRDLTLARIQRTLCHILLRIKKEDVISAFTEPHPPYLRILGFNRTGSQLLSLIKKQSGNAEIPLFLMPKEIDGLLSEKAAGCLAYDLYASNLYRMILTSRTGKSYPTEYTRKYEFHQ